MSTSAFVPFAVPVADAPAAPPVAALPRRRAEPQGTVPLLFPVLPNPEQDEALERARVQGHAAGYAAGRRAATATLEADRAALRADAEREVLELRTAALALRAAAGALNAQAAAALDTADASLLAAAVEIAAAVLGREPVDTEASALGAVRRAVEAAGPLPVRAVRLHPADLALVHEATAGEPGVRLVADGTVARGDARAEVPDGVVDAGVASAMDRVRRALAGDDE